ncbi:MAG: TIGR00730 family Rossman fold protein [Planctomycetota bacterium]
MSERSIQSVCVFCGSNVGSRPIYVEVAKELGRELVNRSWRLVYGAGGTGLMGTVANEVLDCGGEVTGVIPKQLARVELMHEGLTETHVVNTMHERKALMSKLSDALISLPGGFGTLEETFEVITWAQLGIQPHPIGLLNVEGYYDPLLAMVQRGIDDGFIRPQYRQLFVDAPTVSELIDKMLAYEAMPSVLKDMGREGRGERETAFRSEA